MATKFITKGKGRCRKVIPIKDTVKAKAPKRLVPKYSKVDKAIVDMITENTGRAMCDSGDAYGRHFEKNQKIKDWNKVPEFSFDEYGFTRNIFNFLSNVLDITPESQKLQKQFDKFAVKSDESHLNDMESFLDILSKNEDIQSDDYLVPDKPIVYNTYNDETSLSQELQFAIFYKDGEYYVLLQIHNGCDARGGYTAPKIFALSESEQFISNQKNATVQTKKGSYYTDDAYNFYDESNTRKTKQWDELYKEGIVSVN